MSRDMVDTDGEASGVARSHPGWSVLVRDQSLTEEQARRVGVLAGKAGHDDIVDVIVVERAARRRDAIVTSNETLIRAIAEAAGARLHIEHA